MDIYELLDAELLHLWYHCGTFLLTLVMIEYLAFSLPGLC